MSINSSNPSMKRVLNLKQMTHQSIKSNFEIRAKPETDLHRINSRKSASFLLEKRNSVAESFTKYMLRPTSELDGDEDSLKNNPIFHDDDQAKPQANNEVTSENEQVLKIDCEFKHLNKKTLPPPPPPPLPPPFVSQPSITNNSKDSLKREDSIKSALNSTYNEDKIQKSFNRTDSISSSKSTIERQDSAKSFRRDESTKEDFINRSYAGEGAFKAFLDRHESLKSYQREESIKSGRSNYTNANDESGDSKMRNIFPQVALSEVTYEEDSDDETITKSNFDIDLFSHRMGSLKLVERKNSDIVKEVTIRFLDLKS